MLTWIIPKRNILYTTLLEGMTDVHAHLLPNVDGGSESLMDSITALERMREVGVKRIFLTPHIAEECTNNSLELLLAKYSILKECCPADIELYLAAEYMLDNGFDAHKRGKVLTFPGKQILVETSRLSAPEKFLTFLFDLMLEGYKPVIAHPELYQYMTQDDYYFLKDKGYKFQLNLFSLAGLYGKQARSVARILLDKGYYDYVGSDFHRLGDYEKGLKKLYLSGSRIQQINKLFDNNDLLWNSGSLEEQKI